MFRYQRTSEGRLKRSGRAKRRYEPPWVISMTVDGYQSGLEPPWNASRVRDTTRETGPLFADTGESDDSLSGDSSGYGVIGLMSWK